MNPVRIIIVLVAAVSAIGLAVLMQSAMGGKRSETVAAVSAPAIDSKPMTQVLVAKRDLAIGVRLGKDDVEWKAWPADAVSPVYITNGAAAAEPQNDAAKAVKTVGDAAGLGGAPPESAVEGAIVRDPLLAGEPIVARKIVRGGEGGYLSVVLSPGARAMAVPVTSENAVGGFILPGDRVDVLQTHDAPNPDGSSQTKQVVAETVLRNIRVLALDQSTTADKEAKTIVAATATLEVRPEEAVALTRAKAGGPVTLALRAYTDLGGPSGVAADSQDSTVVRINRGGQTSSIAVRQ
ncbi:Flp pilus assembly protein CpaB [Caulobacter hibisci]|uniref:Flp pilus assembly protein CpaB n=1 Tax=Caulobacter hibisci TaxID=2035993 RepID=A0ABS0T2A4_9CAUL|nr:Flp pilus assembly protein CpaB [Caulobacter hibisci]MBI1686007.1 Flp pilus assembly protein CpaB [Caulobacter hibisci]